MSWPDRAASDVSKKAQSREEQHERPQLARPDAAERAVRSGRQQRQHHQRHHAEPHRRPERHVVDARDHRVQPRFFDEYQAEERDDAAGESKRSETSEDARRDDDQRGDFGCGIDILAACGHVGGDDDARCAGEQRDGGSLLAKRQQPSAEARHRAEHRKRANAAEPRAGSVSVTGPLALEPDGSATQCGDEERKDHVWLQKISHFVEYSRSPSAGETFGENTDGLYRSVPAADIAKGDVLATGMAGLVAGALSIAAENTSPSARRPDCSATVRASAGSTLRQLRGPRLRREPISGADGVTGRLERWRSGKARGESWNMKGRRRSASPTEI